MNFNSITPETLERFESLPRVHRKKIVHRMIFYKSCYGTPTGRSEKGLFEIVAFKHIATLCPTCNGSGEIEKIDYNLVCMDCLGSGLRYSPEGLNAVHAESVGRRV